MSYYVRFKSSFLHAREEYKNKKTYIALWYVVLVCYQYDVCKTYVGSVYVGGYGGLSESGLCVFRELCPVSFLVISESPSVCRSL